MQSALPVSNETGTEDAATTVRSPSGPRYLQSSQRAEAIAAENRERAREIKSRSASRGGSRKADARCVTLSVLMV